jgi:CBF1 interacting corepressor
MVAGLKFLSKKGFNPQNFSNQKNVWEREQEKRQETKRLKDREAQLQRERDEEELARARGEIPKVGFLYDVPPGMSRREKYQQAHDNDDDQKPAAVDQHDSSKHDNNVTMDRQPGDDDAAAAFRLLLASSNAGACDGSNMNQDDHSGISLRGAQQGKFGTVLQGSSVDPTADKEKMKDRRAAIEKQSALERAVGAKVGANNLSLEEQIQRFPVLAHAPRAKGMTATDVGVTFKPLGTQIRNVKCMACGIWGHSKGDRECRVSGWDPFAAASVTNTAAADGNASRSNPKKRHHDRHHSSRHQNDEDSMSSSGNSHSSSSTDSSSYERRRRRRKKDKRKRRKRKNSRSDADEYEYERKRPSRRRSRDDDDDEDSGQYQRKKSHKKHR